MYLLAPFILQNFKKILRADPELWGIFGPKTAHLSWTKIFCYKPLLLLSSTYWPFSLYTILKNFKSGTRVMRMCHFRDQNGPFAPNKIFFESYQYHSPLPISPFHLAKFKKNSSSGSRVTRMCNFWAQTGPFPQMRIVFQETC